MVNNKNSHALLLVDLQKGFADSSYWGSRNNPELEANVQSLLSFYRKSKIPIIHVQHLSTEEKSPLRPGQEGAEFISGCEPRQGERVFQKIVNSAFIGTGLKAYLDYEKINSLTIVGLTTDHCVSTTVRMASNYGYKVYLVADCTGTFQRQGTENKFSAELVHQISLASLKGEFAEVISSVKEFETMSLFKN